MQNIKMSLETSTCVFGVRPFGIAINESLPLRRRGVFCASKDSSRYAVQTNINIAINKYLYQRWVVTGKPASQYFLRCRNAVAVVFETKTDWHEFNRIVDGFLSLQNLFIWLQNLKFVINTSMPD